MSPEQILAALDKLCKRGGDVQIGPCAAIDPTNPAMFQAIVSEATPWKSGDRRHMGFGKSASAALDEALSKFVKTSG